MIEERDFLQKFFLPYLKSELVKAGKTLRQVDLRWGISQRQAKHGEYVRLCLEQAVDCDLLIGLVGHRYGSPLKLKWIKAASKQFPWVSHYPLASLTELEIRAAIIQRSSTKGRPSIIIGLKNQCWSYSNEEIRRLLPEEILNDAPQALNDSDEETVKKMQKFRNFIETSGLEQFEYSNSVECNEILVQRTKHFIPKYVAGRRHLGLKNSPTYVRDTAIFESLYSWLDASTPRICLTGGSGTGKTEAMIDFTNRCTRTSWAVVFYSHHLSEKSLLCTIFEQITKQGDSQKQHTEVSLRKSFPNWIRTISDHPKFLLVLDGLEYCRNDEFDELNWFFSPLPENVRCLFSASSRPTAQFLLKHINQGQMLQIKDRKLRDTEKILTGELALYGKHPEPKQVKKWFRSVLHRSPLELKLIVNGLHRDSNDTLQSSIEDYGEFELPELISRQWARITREVEQPEDASLIRAAVYFLRFSKEGLYPEEFRSLVNTFDTSSSHFDPANFCRLQLQPYLVQQRKITLTPEECLRSDMRPNRKEIPSYASHYLSYFGSQKTYTIRTWEAVYPLWQSCENSNSPIQEDSKILLKEVFKAPSLTIELTARRYNEASYFISFLTIADLPLSTSLRMALETADLVTGSMLCELLAQNNLIKSVIEAIATVTGWEKFNPTLALQVGPHLVDHSLMDEKHAREYLMKKTRELTEHENIAWAFLRLSEFEISNGHHQMAKKLVNHTLVTHSAATEPESHFETIRSFQLANIDYLAQDFKLARKAADKARRQLELHSRFDLVIKCELIRLKSLFKLGKFSSVEQYLEDIWAPAVSRTATRPYQEFLMLRLQNLYALGRSRQQVVTVYQLNDEYLSRSLNAKNVQLQQMFDLFFYG